ncbi:MAG: hypothetical protein ABFS08_03570 [Pseudomonadota bacterium]
MHPDGTVEFSDQPIVGGEEIELREAPETEFVPVAPSPVTQTRGRKGGAASREGESSGTITISSPQPNETIWFDGSGVTVSVTLGSALESGQKVEITFDGKVVASGTATSFHLGEVYRGSHTLSAAVVDVGGSLLFSSPQISFHMRQHSVIKPLESDEENPTFAPILPE